MKETISDWRGMMCACACLIAHINQKLIRLFWRASVSIHTWFTAKLKHLPLFIPLYCRLFSRQLEWMKPSVTCFDIKWNSSCRTTFSFFSKNRNISIESDNLRDISAYSFTRGGIYIASQPFLRVPSLIFFCPTTTSPGFREWCNVERNALPNWYHAKNPK